MSVRFWTKACNGIVDRVEAEVLPYLCQWSHAQMRAVSASIREGYNTSKHNFAILPLSSLYKEHFFSCINGACDLERTCEAMDC